MLAYNAQLSNAHADTITPQRGHIQPNGQFAEFGYAVLWCNALGKYELAVGTYHFQQGLLHAFGHLIHHEYGPVAGVGVGAQVRAVLQV